MTDIATIWVPELGRGDWRLSGASLQVGDDLATAVLVSLFTDRAALDDDVLPDGSDNRRGWWGDLGQTVPIGSRLWLLDRAKQTNETLQRAKDYIAEALQWLIEDGVAAAVDVATEWTKPGLLGAQVAVRRGDGTAATVEFAWAWQGITNAV